MFIWILSISTAPEKKPPPPTFSKPLTIDFDGSSAKFGCQIASEAEVKVVWYVYKWDKKYEKYEWNSCFRMRNGEEIKKSSKYEISSTEEHFYTLTVMDVDAATDAGDYVLVASTAGGNLKCTATLDIERKERPL